VPRGLSVSAGCFGNSSLARWIIISSRSRADCGTRPVEKRFHRWLRHPTESLRQLPNPRSISLHCICIYNLTLDPCCVCTLSSQAAVSYFLTSRNGDGEGVRAVLGGTAVRDSGQDCRRIEVQKTSICRRTCQRNAMQVADRPKAVVRCAGLPSGFQSFAMRRYQTISWLALLVSGTSPRRRGADSRGGQQSRAVYSRYLRCSEAGDRASTSRV
jgi:hypothetical protein